jgi:hypothetical protein
MLSIVLIGITIVEREEVARTWRQQVRVRRQAQQQCEGTST